MILEHALLPVRPDRTAEFEAAFEQARPLIARAPGFRSLTLSKSAESPNIYLLLVEWEQLSDHTEGFRGSADYQDWKRLLHHFYDPFPVVQHFTTLCATRSPATTASPANPN
ncbi:antibiotic biosynthesis monooxygenase family protein [Nocardia nova]|uniref:antibiotic biosynthesis monooxygenase family protein n=1 Tax=Nocardia nova TaxID=37330 RepID=UPI0027386397|nr:antibiotic biosynthesis monooxygenase [Nocardia nova]